MTDYDVELIIPDACDLRGVAPGEIVSIRVNAEDYVLAAARHQGIWLPADCQQGWCTTCAGELLDGTVDQSDAIRYFATDRSANLILLCTAKPTSNLRIRVCQHERMLEHRASHGQPPGRSKR